MLETRRRLNWALHLPRGLLPRGISRSGGYNRFYFFHRSSKNKQGTAGVGYFERWRRSISVKETSECSLGLLAASLGGMLSCRKGHFSPPPTPAFSSRALATTIGDSFSLSMFKRVRRGDAATVFASVQVEVL